MRKKTSRRPRRLALRRGRPLLRGLQTLREPRARLPGLPGAAEPPRDLRGLAGLGPHAAPRRPAPGRPRDGDRLGPGRGAGDVGCAAYVSASRRRTFAYGSFDCALFAAGAIKVQTGVDLRQELAGRYTTEIGAARVLRWNGFADPAEVAGALLTPIPVAAARQGDVAAIRTGAGIALAVVGGPHLLAACAGSGLIALPLTAAVAAFRV
jgi:hypothetical protein